MSFLVFQFFENWEAKLKGKNVEASQEKLNQWGVTDFLVRCFLIPDKDFGIVHPRFVALPVSLDQRKSLPDWHVAKEVSLRENVCFKWKVCKAKFFFFTGSRLSKLVFLPIEILRDQMGASEKDGDVQSFRSACLSRFLGSPGSGSKEGGARHSENDGRSPSALRSVSSKFHGFDKSSGSRDEKYRVGTCLASCGRDGIRLGGGRR